MNRQLFLYPFLVIFLLTAFFIKANAQRPPNVILILTDDQGIGDLGCHGNPWLKTPNIDAFYKDAIRLTDFHVSPMCTPTRSAIMTGRYPINNGAWATYKGRDLLSETSLTMADVFQQNGYATGMFGKWHLGDNYPVRPTDCGFEVAVQHLAGGVGELSDYWGNSYFDDVYYVNNQPKQFKGYCTDVWFQQAMNFMKQNREKPFFVYLPTNAAHSPFIVAEKYAEPYRELEAQHKIVNANFYGMIANIDENFGRLENFLTTTGLADNTILIFMTDNGSSAGISRDGKVGFNKGFRGMKGGKTEGGHRVPFFIRWKDGKISGGRDISEIASHVDLLPTLAALCGLKVPEKMTLDGVDFSSLLLKKKSSLDREPIFVHHRQDWRPPMDVAQTCIAQGKWRLLDGKELFDTEADPMQLNNLAAKHPDLVQQLLAKNKVFTDKAKTNPVYRELPFYVVGNKAQDEIKLTIQHAIGEDEGIWQCEQVAAGIKNRNNTHALKIEKEGSYVISCRRWPKECGGPILGIPKENPKNLFQYKVIQPQKVRIQIANQLLEKEISPKDEAVEFHVTLDKGKTLLVTDFIEGKEQYGVYYTYIRSEK